MLPFTDGVIVPTNLLSTDLITSSTWCTTKTPATITAT